MQAEQGASRGNERRQGGPTASAIASIGNVHGSNNIITVHTHTTQEVRNGANQQEAVDKRAQVSEFIKEALLVVKIPGPFRRDAFMAEDDNCPDLPDGALAFASTKIEDGGDCNGTYYFYGTQVKEQLLPHYE